MAWARLGTIGSCAALALLTLGSRAFAAEPRVVVTTKPIHSLVAQVMAGNAQGPHLLVDGAASPHTYALKPSDAALVNRADVLIRVSDSVEPFTQRLIRTMVRSALVVTLGDAPGVSRLPVRTGATFERHAHGGAGVGHKHAHSAGVDIDGHQWLDPTNALAFVDAIAEALAARDAERADRYRANAAGAKRRIAVLQMELARELADVRDKPFIVLHDAYQYLEQRFGLYAAGSVQISHEIQPSARRIAEVRKKIASLGAVCVFGEPGPEAKILATVIEGSRARPATLDPEALNLSPGPDLYERLMIGLARDINACLSAP